MFSFSAHLLLPGLAHGYHTACGNSHERQRRRNNCAWRDHGGSPLINVASTVGAEDVAFQACAAVQQAAVLSELHRVDQDETLES